MLLCASVDWVLLMLGWVLLSGWGKGAAQTALTEGCQPKREVWGSTAFMVALDRLACKSLGCTALRSALDERGKWAAVFTTRMWGSACADPGC